MALAVRVLTVAVMCAMVMAALAWMLQRRLIYLPTGQPAAAPEQVLEGGSAVVLHTEDGLDLTAWHAPATGPATGITVLVLPGNAGIRRGPARLPGLRRQPRLTDRRLAADARAAHRHLLAERGVPPARLVLFGESLGAAVAARLALERPVAGLVLRSPFTSLADVGAQHYPFLPGPGAAAGSLTDPANHRDGHRADHSGRWGRRRDRAAGAEPGRRRRLH
jgi:uncharacterized protein